MISFVADKFWKDKFYGDKFCGDMFCMGSYYTYIFIYIIKYTFYASLQDKIWNIIFNLYILFIKELY